MNQKNPDRTKLLWVKLPENHADRLASEARNMGVSRADLMRLILIHYVQNNHTFTINTNANTK
jgi:hypothetical protein